MSYIWIIARHQWREMVRDGRALWTSMLLVALTASAVASGASHLRQVRAEQEAAARSEREVWLTQKPKSPHTAAHHGFFVFQHVLPLAAFDPGVLDYVGSVRHLEAHGEKLARFTPAEDRPAVRQFPWLSAAQTWQVIVPLLLVVLLYGAIAQDRDSGTLMLVLSQGVPSRLIAAGRTVGALLPVLAAGIVTAFIVARVVAGAEQQCDVEVWLRAAMAGIVHLCWLLLFACAVLTISARARTARQALVVSLSLWMGMAVLGPRLAVEMAVRMAPVPSPQQFLAALREADKDRPSYWEDLVPAATARLLTEYGVMRVEDLPVSPASVAQLDQEDDDTARVGRVFERLTAQHEAQERIVTRLSWLVPLLAVRQISAAMTATDAWHARRFAQHAEDYRRRAVRLLNEDSVRHNTGDFLQTGVRHEADERLWSQIPPFEYSIPAAAELARVHALAIGALACWLVLAVTGAVWATRRLAIA